MAAVALIYMLWGKIYTANLSNCDFPNPGSPNNSIWLDYLNVDYRSKFLDDPPTMPSNIPSLTISWPKIVGQKDLTKEYKISGSFLN